MRSKLIWMMASVALIFSLQACSDDETQETPQDYDPEWSQESPRSTGKSDIADFAQPIPFGESVKGSVDETELDIYKMELTANDSFTMVMDVTEGDLAPDFRLFYGTSTSIRSDTFDVTSTQLTKGYTVDTSGTYLVIVRAYRNRGAGNYTLGATCDGGPCNGEFNEPVGEYDYFLEDACTSRARDCAFQKMTDLEDSLEQEAARQLYRECMAETAIDGDSCASICDKPEAYGICDSVGDLLVFYSQQDTACHNVLSDCMDECGEYAGVTLAEFDSESTAEGTCLFYGFNGTCDGYAQAHEACGGTLEPDTIAECTVYCWSTIGATIDDMDVICEEECGECDEACQETIDKL